MKVIAEIKDDRVLVEVSKEELANILGVYGKHNLSDINESWASIMNKEVAVSDIYINNNRINDAQHTPEYATARTKLKELLEALTPIEELIIKLNNIKDGD